MPRDSETTKSDRQLIEETAQRARRTETKVNMIADNLGVDVGGDKPVLKGDILYVPSRKVSLQDVLEALGELRSKVLIYCGDDYLTTVQR